MSKEKSQTDDFYAYLSPQEQETLRNMLRGRHEHNLEVEQILLGAVMANNKNIAVCPHLLAEDFYDATHQRLWQIINKFYLDGGVADPVTLGRYFENRKYLLDLVVMSTMALDIKSYADQIVDLSYRRRVSSLLMKHLLSPFECMYAHEWGDAILNELMNIPTDAGKRSESWQQVSKRLYNYLLEGGASATPTGIECIDAAMTGGLYEGRLHGFIAPSGAGKTALALSIFTNVVNHYHKKKLSCDAAGTAYQQEAALYICSEMGSLQCHERVQAREMEANASDFYTLKDDIMFLGEVGVYAEEKATKPGRYYASARITLSELKRVMTTEHRRFNVRIFFIDYLSLIKPDQGKDDIKHLEDTCAWLQNFCVENNVSVVVLEQAKKDGTTRWGDALFNNSSYFFVLLSNKYTVNGCPGVTCAWLKPEKSRHSEKISKIGSPAKPALILDKNGPYYRDVTAADDVEQEARYSAVDDDG